MKLIVDFDDVLFDTARFKSYIFKTMEIHGVNNVKDFYDKERKINKPFSLRYFIQYAIDITEKENDTMKKIYNVEEIYNNIISACPFFINDNMVEIMKNEGKQNCFIVTNGEIEYQNDKISKTGIGELCQKVYIVPRTKKDVIKELCTFFSSEIVIFIDDKSKFFEDIDMEVCKNLTTVLYNENGFENLKAEIAKSKESDRKI